jgi:hypothetical protein
MWDITVDGAHTFFVGPGAVLVHNCPMPTGPKDSGSGWQTTEPSPASRFSSIADATRAQSAAAQGAFESSVPSMPTWAKVGLVGGGGGGLLFLLSQAVASLGEAQPSFQPHRSQYPHIGPQR